MITGRTLGLCVALAVSAWAVTVYLDPERRKQLADSQFQQPPAAAAVVLSETGIRAGSTATTDGGMFTIRVDRVSGAIAKLTISAKTGDVYRFDKVEAGNRLVIPAPDATYYMDVIHVRNGTVQVGMNRRQ